MNNYKETLNLPQTDFPMKANLSQREPLILKRWQDINLYLQLRHHCQKRPKFILHDGPPYANARPHLGTALNKILKDIVIKSKTLSGFDVPYIPGWDCHGLPVELNVEKKVGKPKFKISPKEFRQACRQYAKQQVELQLQDFKRLGVIGDWENPYLTMDFSYEANTVRALAKIIANGHLHRGQKPVHWCTSCNSALAEAEVEYKDKQSPAIDVVFNIIEKEKIKKLFPSFEDQWAEIIVPIWTTTPWTLPANEAVSVHPEIEYSLVQDSTTLKCFIVASERLADVMERYAVIDYKRLGSIEGKALEHILLQHPFLDRKVPIILGYHVTTEMGTGCVHTAPAHGVDDYEVGLQYGLPLSNPVNANSCFEDNIPFVAGKNVFDANSIIINHLQQEAKLLSQAAITHSYPHCWRHKTSLIFRATPQWFISMDQKQLRENALKEIQGVKWVPAKGQHRIETMIASRPDWCISRQRTWGVPITLFINKKTQELHPDMFNLMETIALKIEQEGIDSWFDSEPSTLLGAEADQYEKITDVLDVWFDSGVSHFCVLEHRPLLEVPADLYLEGSDQHRGWFQTSLLTSTAMREHAPFKAVLTHGYVVDGKGFKMSKSLGNVIVPEEIINKYGADILRLWVAAADYRNDISASAEILERSADTYRRIRNTSRFLLANINDFNPESDKVPFDEMLALDRWIVLLTESLQAEIIDSFDSYNFQMIYQKIHNFCTVQLGSFYLDIIKDRQYTSKKDGLPRRSAQTALYYIIEALVRWLAPILSFTAEEIWQYLPGQRPDSVFLTTWFQEFPQSKKSIDELSYWQSLMIVRDEVNKILESFRQAGKIGSALDAEVILYARDSLLDDLKKLGDELRFVLITSSASILPLACKSENAIATAMPELYVQVEISSAFKCSRCWQRRTDVGKNLEHQQLCGRCIENIGAGEYRLYA